ncbi:hypothetical protein [Vreelandella arcis]|uniref:hypothetical protein n=1 Tax=Vreelandella arcis TaxID=416873 RepID=UPI00147E9030|nr:hypothetical protein [Halomonas arcis]
MASAGDHADGLAMPLKDRPLLDMGLQEDSQPMATAGRVAGIADPGHRHDALPEPARIGA